MVARLCFVAIEPPCGRPIALFKDDWEGIIGNADSFIYLGGNEQSTHKYISELLGKETIDTRTSSQSKGRNGSFSQNFQQTGRELMTPDEVRRLDNKNAIVLIRGEKPVIDEKYDIDSFCGEEIDSKIDNALSGLTSINESAQSSNGFFTEEEQEDRETDSKILPIPINKKANSGK